MSETKVAKNGKEPLESVILLRSFDPVRVRQIAALLEDEGIHCSTPGLEHRSMLGLDGAYLEIAVHVPGADAERARELVHALDEGVPVDPLEEEEAEGESPRELNPRSTYRESAVGEESPSPAMVVRLRRIVVFAAFICPAGGQLYTRRYGLALVVLALYALTTFALFSDVPFAWIAIVAVLAVDITAGTYQADLSQGRRVQGSARAWAVHAATVFVPSALFLLAGPVASELAGPNGRVYCDAVARCGGEYGQCVRERYRLRDHTEPLTAMCADCMEESACVDQGSCSDECNLGFYF